MRCSLEDVRLGRGLILVCETGQQAGSYMSGPDTVVPNVVSADYKKVST